MTKETTETTTRVYNNYHFYLPTRKSRLLETIISKYPEAYQEYIEMIESDGRYENREEWVEVDGYPNYEVSSYGLVRSKDRVVLRSDGIKQRRTGKLLSPAINNYGYLMVSITNDYGTKSKTVHRLVLKAFNPTQNMDEMEVNHKDLDKCNNHITNLEWVTGLQNSQHAHANNAFDYEAISCENSANATLTNQEAIDIVELYNTEGFTQDDLSEIFGVTSSAISKVLTGRTFSLVTGIQHKRQFEPISDDTATKIIIARRSGRTCKSVSEEFGVSLRTVSNLEKGIHRQYLQELI